ncbi:MAG: hypothetical protein A2Z04_00400 [Chloroflexi bacterium RBG_16_57_9]|nr:MAG: hypothetical protein A2Z04_00400 [Chloroflexi bacterium RBG_16_57_9]
MNRKPFLVSLGELVVAYWPRPNLRRRIRWLLPTPGNALFTLLVVGALLWAQSAGAFPNGRPQGATSTSTGTLAYQGRLANASGTPITDTVNMSFRLYNVASGGTPLWNEQWTGSNGVKVSDGLFNVMRGSLTAIPQSVVTGNSSLWLGITVGTDDEMTPRVQLGSVPFAVQALTVPDGSITPTKLDRQYVNKAGDTMTGNIQMDGHALYQTGNIFGHGQNPAQIHMPAPQNGDLFINWHSGGRLVFGGGKGDPQFLVDTNGNLWAKGTKSAIVQAGEFGKRTLYAVEAPDVRFSDEGAARLKDGVARVTLDPVFLETIEGEYLVHVTPYGDASLYVAEVGKDYFVVKAREGDPNVAFAWRLSAHRKGYGGVRLEEVERVESTN